MNCVYYHMWQNNVDKMVYHYTSIESAKKILETKSLRFGRLNGMNDINESYRAIWYPHEAEDVDKYENAVYSYRQISLTLDKPTKRGFDIPPMWGHYAQKGAGVCIVNYSSNGSTTGIAVNDSGKKFRHISFPSGRRVVILAWCSAIQKCL